MKVSFTPRFASNLRPGIIFHLCTCNGDMHSLKSYHQLTALQFHVCHDMECCRWPQVGVRRQRQGGSCFCILPRMQNLIWRHCMSGLQSLCSWWRFSWELCCSTVLCEAALHCSCSKLWPYLYSSPHMSLVRFERRGRKCSFIALLHRSVP